MEKLEKQEKKFGKAESIPPHSQYEVLNERKFKYPEIEELQEPLHKVFEQLRPMIERGNYQLIVGDDSSGRSLTLIFDKVLNWLYAERNLSLPDTIFIAGSRGLPFRQLPEKQNKIEEFLKQRLRGIHPRKALVVTDTVLTGIGLTPLLEALRNLNIDYDVATIGYSQEVTREPLFQGKIYGAHLGTPTSYGSEALRGGVLKNSWDLFSRPSKRVFSSDNPLHNEIQREINEIREDIDMVAEHIIDWYNTKNKNEK